MKDVSTLRLVVLRLTYLLLAVGLAFEIWPLILHHPTQVENMKSAVRALLGGIGLLALIGLRYPLKMLPLLLFELAWKTIWVIAFGIPMWRAHAFTPDTLDTWHVCLESIVLFVVVIPWGYIWRAFVKQPADPWRRRVPAVDPEATQPHAPLA